MYVCIYIYIYTQKTDTITCRLMYTITYHYLWFFDIAIKSIVEIIDRQITVETSWWEEHNHDKWAFTHTRAYYFVVSFHTYKGLLLSSELSYIQGPTS